MELRDANHPVWPLARTVVFMTALALILWLNAEDFDATEIRTIISMFLGAIGIEGVTAAVTHSKRSE